MKTYFKLFAAIALLAATACNKMNKDNETSGRYEVYSVIQVNRAPSLSDADILTVIDQSMHAVGMEFTQPVIIITGNRLAEISAEMGILADSFIDEVQSLCPFMSVSISFYAVKADTPETDRDYYETLARRDLNPLVQAGMNPNLIFQTTVLSVSNGEGQSLVVRRKGGDVIKTVQISTSFKSFYYKDLGMLSGDYQIEFAGKTYDITTSHGMLAYNVIVVVK